MAPEPRFRTRRVSRPDMAALVPLFQAYMLETYGTEWSGSVEPLYRDALGQKCTLYIAVAEDGAPIGFLAWIPSYDLHHCVSGAEVLDLYVSPPWRGRGVALLLACTTAAEVSDQGGLYMKGSAVEQGSGRRLYSRFCVCDAASCVVSGRAFRRLAELAGRSAREVARSLPDRSWNYEA